MKKFFINILLFSTIIILLTIGLEFVLYKYSKNNFTLKRDKLSKDGESISTLVLGNSHCELGINPQLLNDSAFNCAYHAREPYYDLQILNKYLKKLPNLKCVIWNLPYCLHNYYVDSSFTNPMNRDVSVSLKCNYEKYFNIPPNNNNKYLYWIESIYNRWEGPLFLRVFNSLQYCDDLGWAPRDDTPNLDAHCINPNEDFSLPDVINKQIENIHYVCNIAQICKDNGIRFVILTCPYAHHNKELIKEDGIYWMNRCIDDVKKCNPLVEYYNYMFDPRFENEDFIDGGHLCRKGAIKFSQILKDDLF